MKIKQTFIGLCSLFVLTSLSTTTTAQVTIGSAESPISGALLDLKQETKSNDLANSSKGLGLPRVGLTDREQLEPCSTTNATNKASHIGLTVYNVTDNSSTVATLKEGVYLWDGDMWQPMGLKAIQGFGPWYQVDNPALPSRTADTDSYLDAKAVVGGTTTIGNAALSVHGNISTGNGSAIQFYEKSTNGSNKITVKSPDNLAVDRNFTLPQNAPASGYALVTDASGNTSWSAVNPSASTIASIAFNASMVTPVPIPVNGKTGGLTLQSFFQEFGTVVSDQHSLFDLSTGTYTAPQGGVYLISAYVVPNAAPYQNQVGYYYPVNLEVKKNCTPGDPTTGTIVMDNAVLRYATPNAFQLRYTINVSGILSLSPGDRLNLVISLNGSNPKAANGGISYPEQFSYATLTTYKAYFSVTAL